MPGGRIDVIISADFNIRMMGPVTRIAEGVLAAEMFDRTAAGI